MIEIEKLIVRDLQTIEEGKEDNYVIQYEMKFVSIMKEETLLILATKFFVLQENKNINTRYNILSLMNVIGRMIIKIKNEFL
tara:strand:- start:255 stop:500 length:246 start_codon:yes stop_codon:yes gene_type:complete